MKNQKEKMKEKESLSKREVMFLLKMVQDDVRMNRRAIDILTNSNKIVSHGDYRRGGAM